MKLAQNEIIILLNSDTTIPSFFAEKIISRFKTCPNITTASPIRCDKFGYYINFPFWYSLEKINKKLESVFEKCSEIPSTEGFCYCINKNIIEKSDILMKNIILAIMKKLIILFVQFKKDIKTI